MMQYSVLWVDKDVRLYPAVPYKSAFRAVVLLEDHEHALAEKDLEIAKLTGERDKYKKEALAKFDCEVCSGSLEDENERLRQQLAQVTAERDNYRAGMADYRDRLAQVKTELNKDEHDKLRADYRVLLTEAVQFAVAVRDYVPTIDMFVLARSFLSRPHVQAFLKETQHERR